MSKIVNAAASRTTQNVAVGAAPATSLAVLLIERLIHMTPAIPWEEPTTALKVTATGFLAAILTALRSRGLAFLGTPTKRATPYKG